MYEHGYFRDSYNSTSVMQRLGLSWWADISKMCDKDGNLSVEKSIELKAIVEKRPVKLVSDVKELKDMNCNVDGPDPVGEWNQYWIKKKQNFLDFLDEAIRLHQPIYCSC
jgi:hypothetical protein